MNIHFSQFIITSIILGLSLGASPAIATNQDEFNPNFLLSDEEMQDWNSMTRADIQAFLNEQGGAIARLKTADKENTKRVTSDIIARASKEHKINPKYLLVKLQKEQSLITEDSPSQKQLDGATGYGITDGCGWDCETYKRNKGFGKQVDSAAGIMRWYYDHVSTESWIKKPNTSYDIDNIEIKPATYATAFLYTYTPHLQGNENFWKLWQKWFDQVYPDGTLVKTQHNSTVYLIQNGQKRKFSSTSALTTRFDPKLILTIPYSELGRYESGKDITMPNYTILKQNTKYYLLDYDTLRPFQNAETVRTLGYHPDEIIDITAADVALFSIGKTITAENKNPIGGLLRMKENKKLYYYNEGTLSPIFDDQIAKVNFPHLSIKTISAADLPAAELGTALKFKDGTLIKEQSFSKVYVIEKGKKRHIASEEVFNGMGYNWDHIIETNQFAALNHPTGQPIYLRREMNTTTPAPTQTIVAGETAPQTETTSISDLMVRTPKTDWQFIGEAYQTDIDSYLIADADTKEILAGKNIDTLRPTASLTKVMTGYRLMKENLPLSKVTEYSAAKHKATYHHFRIAEGEKIFNKDLLNAFLVSSLNTPGKMLVSAVEPKESSFIKKMNDQAAAWGTTKTTFVDVTGEHINSVTTARDYLHIFHPALKNATIKKTLAKKTYQYTEFKDLDDKPDHFDTHSNDLTQASNLSFTILASKTGYLYESGANLALLVKRNSDGKQFIIITMGNVDFSNRFDAPKSIANWAMSHL
jgi:D-alanyl-D-alanine carboxypeptidase